MSLSGQVSRLIADSTREATAVKVFTYSNRAEADALWSELEIDAPLSHYSDIIIVFDGLPEDWKTDHPFRPEFWLTPWDWALAMSTAFLRNPKVVPALGFRCWILDLLPTDGGTAGRRRFKLARAFAPWIRSYRPIAAGARQFTDDLSEIWTDLPSLSAAPALSPDSARSPDAHALRSVWLSLLAAPGDRHAIGNLVGPILLAEGVERRLGRGIPLRLDWPTLHFRSLLRSVGFADSEPCPSNETIGPFVDESSATPSIQNDVLGQLSRIRWLLVDDHASLGYHDVLSGLLFGDKAHHENDSKKDLKTTWTGDERRLVFRSTGHPMVLLNELHSAFRKNHDWKSPRVIGGALFDIVFLDLRLFPTSTTDSPSDDERQFLGELLTFCLAERRSWPEDERLEAAVLSAQRRRDGGREELPALTLLPLLLSYADPSLPIVVFSSSHQHEVAHAFAHRPNLIATFSKPIMTGYAAIDTASMAVDELLAALRESLRLHRLRPIWVALVELSTAMAGRDWPITEDRLQVYVRDDYGKTIPKTFRLTLFSSLVERVQLEFVNLLLRRRYADSLLMPHNILEAAASSWEGDDLVSPDDLPKADYMSAVADLQFYRVLAELRNARAHYQCQPIRDDATLEQTACWAWLLFIVGCQRLLKKDHLFVPAQRADDSNVVRAAKNAWLMPLSRGLGKGPGKNWGLKRCHQIVGKVGHLISDGLIDAPGRDSTALVDYARHVANLAPR